MNIIFTFRDNRRPFSALINITENRWNEIENKLENLSSRVARIRQQVGLKPTKVINSPLENSPFQDFVIQANPDYPPYSVQIFLQALSQVVPIHVSVHVHSSLKTDIDFELKDFLALETKLSKNRGLCKYGITVIWKETSKDPTLVVNPANHIEGEVNIIRYLSRLIESLDCNFSGIQHSIKYDSLPSSKLALIDEQLDSIHNLVHTACPNAKKNIIEKYMKSWSDTSEDSSVADIALLSVCKQDKRRNNTLPKEILQCVKKASNKCASSNPFIPRSLLTV